MISDRFTDDDKLIATRGLLENFVRYVKSGHTRNRILFIGYEAGQIPPALHSRYLRDRFGLSGRVVELTDVKRQAEGSSILRSATSLRDAMRFGTTSHIESERVSSLQGTVNAYLRTFDPRNLESAIYIAAHGSLRLFNTAVRERLGRTDALAVGDVVVFHQNFVGTDYTAFNGDFGTVTELVCGIERFGGLHFQQVVVAVTDERGQTQSVSGKVCLDYLRAEKPELM